MEALVVAQIVVSAVQDNLFALGVGFAACCELLRQAGAAPAASLYRAQSVCCAALLAAYASYLWLQSAIMAGTPFADAGGALSAVLTQSHFGYALLLGSGGLAAALLGTLLMRRGTVVAGCGVLLYAAAKAAASHAADAGDFSLAEAVQAVHLLATATWAGCVMATALGTLRGARGLAALLATPERQVAYRSELSHLATLAMAVVIMTGLYNFGQSAAQTNAPLLATAYGRLLALKLALVVSAIALGGWNRFIVLPRLEAALKPGEAAHARAAAAGLRRFDRLLAIEACVMALILITAAVLGHTPPTGFDG